jgi:hypothetical protein
MVLYPTLSEKLDHHNGNTAIPSIYSATDKLVSVCVAPISCDICDNAGKRIADAIGAEAAAKATTNVMSFLVRRE